MKEVCWTAVGLAFIVVGCGGGADSGASQGPGTAQGGELAAEVPALCTSFCQREDACGGTFDRETCNAQCKSDLGPGAPKFRDDFVSSVHACVGSVDCPTVLMGYGVDKCLAQSLVALTPSQVATSFCDVWANAATNCGEQLDKNLCLGIVKRFSDGALGDAAHCFAGTCADVKACLDAALP